jgi:hypothetical protein
MAVVDGNAYQEFDRTMRGQPNLWATGEPVAHVAHFEREDPQVYRAEERPL